MSTEHRDPELREGQHYTVAENGCWEWLGFRRRGYGWVRRGAHRVMYEQRIGPIPEGHDLHHRCENRGCVNPAHLEPVLPGAHRKAHQRGDSPLTEADVIAMREAAYRREASIDELATRYGVGPTTVTMIVAGLRWGDVGGPVGPPGTGECAVCGASLAGLDRRARYCSLRCRQTRDNRKRRGIAA